MSGLYYLLPFQRGYLVNWDTQRQIWDHVFNEVLSITPSDHNLVFTEPLFNFPSIQDTLHRRSFLRSTNSHLFFAVLRQHYRHFITPTLTLTASAALSLTQAIHSLILYHTTREDLSLKLLEGLM